MLDRGHLLLLIKEFQGKLPVSYKKKIGNFRSPDELNSRVMVKVGISSDHFYLNSMSILTSSRFLQKSSSWTVTLQARYSTQYSAHPGVQRPFFYITGWIWIYRGIKFKRRGVSSISYSTTARLLRSKTLLQ